MNPYVYPATKPDFNLCLKDTTGYYSHYTVDFTSAFSGTYPESRTVRGEYFQPLHNGTGQLVVLLHGMGDHSVIPCRWLAKSLLKKGIACFIMYLVVHSGRLPAAIKERFPVLTSEEWFEAYRMSVIEVRQVIDWATSRQEVNGNKVSVVGISLGGFISAIAMGIDRRIGKGVFIVVGGNGEKINQTSSMTRLTRWRKLPPDQYQELQESYARYLAEVAEKGFENVEPGVRGFLTDPMTFGYLLRDRPVLMINARWDEAIPKEATLDLWKEAGRPQILWLPGTHASVWVWYPLIFNRIYNFLSSV